MSDKLHIVRVVADEVRRQYYYYKRERMEIPRPRILQNEIGVEFDDGEFIPYADLGYSGDIGFFRLSETADVDNDAIPYAASGHLIDCGQVIVTMGVSTRLTNAEIRELIDRHASGDYGAHGEFYELEVSDDLLRGDPVDVPAPGPVNKVNTLTGLDAIVSAYTVRDHRIWVITEAGEKRSTVMAFAGPVRD